MAARPAAMRIVIVIAIALLFAACAPVFAPPVRSTHGGAPGRLASHQAEARLAGTIYRTGGGSVAYAISDHVAVEGGIDASESWLMSSVGGKLGSRTPVGPAFIAYELELGGGLGVGGACDDTAQCGSTPEVPAAYGGYAGAGFALGSRWVSGYGRFRIQLTDGDGLPMTKWLSGVVGVEAAAGPHVLLHLAGGAAGYSNALDSVEGVLVETGIALRWDTRSN